MFTFTELIHMVIMTVAVSYMFMGLFKTRKEDPLEELQRGFDWEGFKTAALVTAPALILHELGHKFVALAFGLQATFQAAFLWLALGVFLKIIKSPFIFLIPAFVAVAGFATPGERALIAFAGPAVNLLIAGIAHYVVKTRKLTRKQFIIWHSTRQLNLFLFVFNLIPIPPFDGSTVLEGIRSTLGF